MEVGFMEFLEPFPIKILVIISILLIGCEGAIQEDYSVEVVDKASIDLESKNGVIFKNGQKFSGALIQFYTNSQDTLVYESYKNGAEDGVWKKYYPGNILAEERSYKKGIKVGFLKKWWPNGKPQVLYTFVLGEYEGEGLE